MRYSLLGACTEDYKYKNKNFLQCCGRGSMTFCLVRIRTIDLRIRILLFSSVADKMPTVFLLISFRRYIYINFIDKKVKKKSQNSRNQGCCYFFCFLMDGIGSPKNIRILIHNTDFLMVFLFCRKHAYIN
jgi:hypothetical protein